MKITAPVIVFTSSMLFAQGKISDFQWKYRLLVVSGADEKIVRLLETEEAGMDERDLKIFILSGSGKKEYAARPELADEFNSRLKPPAAKPTVYLIGKDGRTTLEWPLSDFTIQKLYASIDAMPMRKREMREGKF
jgi:hypothetical protein